MSCQWNIVKMNTNVFFSILLRRRWRDNFTTKPQTHMNFSLCFFSNANCSVCTARYSLSVSIRARRISRRGMCKKWGCQYWTQSTMFALVKSMSALNLPSSSSENSDQKKARTTCWIPFLGRTRRICMVSNTLGSIDSDGEEDKQVKNSKRVESRRRLTEIVSNTCVSLLHSASWSYERKWRKERKAGFDPITVYIGSSDMEDVPCDCGQCPCKHDV